MGVIAMSDYPVLVELIHNDEVISTYDDGFGEISVYLIRTIHTLNRSNETIAFVAVDTKGKTYSGTINPGQDVTINIPTARRFESSPLTVSLSLTRVT